MADAGQGILRFFSPLFLNRGLWQPPRCHDPRFHNASLARAAGLV